MATSLDVGSGVSVYPLAASGALPQWLSDAARRALKRDAAHRRRVELIQDFGFPSGCASLALSGSGRYIVATGTYPPRVRVFDTVDKSMKFERYMDAAPVAGLALGEDAPMMAFLREDRTLEVHAGYGRHAVTRIPLFGRDMAYHAPTAELLIGAGGRDVYRLSLEEGRFMAPLVSGAPGVNRVAVSRVTALIATGCDGGLVQVWDPRSPERAAGSLRLAGGGGGACDVTALAFDERSLSLGVGSSDGRALLFDLRSSRPALVKPHAYGLPVRRLLFHRGAGGGAVVLSADARVVRLWRRLDGAPLTTIEVPAPLTDMLLASDEPAVGGADSGLLLVGAEQERIASYYIPALGPAPRWASYLDSLTEELEEEEAGGAGGLAAVGGGGASAGAGAGAGGVGAVYDNYRFVTREELGGLGLAHLVGTPLLRAYMHGFFIDARLHGRVAALLAAEGGAPAGGASEAWRAARARALLAEAQGSRISIPDALPPVNAELAARLRAAAGAGGAGARAGAPQAGAPAGRAARAKPAAGETAPAPAPAPAPPTSLLADARFSALFSNPDYAIEALSEDFARRHPHLAQAAARAGGKGTKRGRRDADSEDEAGAS